MNLPNYEVRSYELPQKPYGVVQAVGRKLGLIAKADVICVLTGVNKTFPNLSDSEIAIVHQIAAAREFELPC